MFYDGNYVNDAAPRPRHDRAAAPRAVAPLRHGGRARDAFPGRVRAGWPY